MTQINSYALTAEQRALLAVARDVWTRKGLAKSLGLTISEETITETILMDLALSFPGRLSVLQFTKPSEGKRGADWAWLFRDQTGGFNLPLLVQAKSLDRLDVEYPEIKRHVGKSKPPPVRQIDTLIDTAQNWGWPAIYAFYNHLSAVSRVPSNCHSLSGFGGMPESWGISIADAHAVRAALDDQTFDTHRMHSKPLHCLLCSAGLGIRPTAGGSAELARASLENLFASDTRRPTLLKEPPTLFLDALRTMARESPAARASGVAALSEQHPNIAGVVVLQDGADT